MNTSTGPGRPPKYVAQVTAGRRAELEKLRDALWSRMEGASARDAAALSAQIRALAGELSAFDEPEENADERLLRELREKREARQAAQRAAAQAADAPGAGA